MAPQVRPRTASACACGRAPRATAHPARLRHPAQPRDAARPAGQGLKPGPEVKGASIVYADVLKSLRGAFGKSQAWKRAYKLAPKSACAAVCSAGGRPAGAGGGAEESDVLLLATSPAEYSSDDLKWTGGARVLSPPREQGPCATCVALAVAAAAEAAAASATGATVSVSVQAS